MKNFLYRNVGASVRCSVCIVVATSSWGTYEYPVFFDRGHSADYSTQFKHIEKY